MDVAEFERLLHIGLGRAILFLQKNDATPYREAILHACLHDVGYDRQFEPSRAQYLWEIVQLTGEETFFREQIVEGFLAAQPEPEGDDYDTEQLFELLAVLAEQGDVQARQLIYDRFAQNAARDGREIGAYTIINLDGIDGFLFIAEQLIARGIVEGEQWIAGHLLEYVEWLTGKEETQAVLEDVAMKDRKIAALLEREKKISQNAARRSEERAKLDPSTLTYEEAMQAQRRGLLDFKRLRYDQVRQFIVERVVTGGWYWGQVYQWGRKAPDAAVEQAAHDLLAEEDRGRLIPYLSLFRGRKFPLDYSRLLELAQSADEELASWALQALEPISDPSVRQLGLRLLEAGQHRAGAVGLLVNNYEAGDLSRIKQAIDAETNEEVIHSIGYDLRKLAETYRTSDAAGALKSFYEKGPCSLCREKTVDLMLWLDVLPEWVREECRYDANLDIRVLVAEE